LISRRAFLVLALAGAAGASCQRALPAYTARFPAFGQTVDLSIVGAPRSVAEAAAAAVAEDFATMTEAWSPERPGTLAIVNRRIAAGEPFAAPPDLLDLITLAQQIAIATDDLYNPALGHLCELWGFQRESPDPPVAPAETAIRKVLDRRPRMRDLKVDGLRVSPGNTAVQLDFGGLAKGRGLDVAREHLRDWGIHSALISAGSDTCTMGSRDRYPWRITIRRPNGTGVFGTLDTEGDESVCTSGEFGRTFVWNGRRHHRLIDPRTGRPSTGVASVTVAHPSAALAAAASQALLSAGASDWHGYARRLGLRYVLLVTDDGAVHGSPEMLERLSFVDRPANIVTGPPLGDTGPS
jgi:thiamine biosynthesis lipoprotein